MNAQQYIKYTSAMRHYKRGVKDGIFSIIAGVSVAVIFLILLFI